MAWPLRLGPSGDFATFEQGSWDEVAQAVRIVAATRVGDRGDSPTLGTDELVPGHDCDLAGWVAAIERWEPRARVTAAVDGARLHVAVALLADDTDTTGVS